MLVSPSFLSSSFILTLFPNQKQNCYRNSLQLLVENNGQSIAFSVINSEKRGYPPENGVHIAIRNTTDPPLSWHLPLPILFFFGRHGAAIFRAIWAAYQYCSLLYGKRQRLRIVRLFPFRLKMRESGHLLSSM